MSLEHLSDGQKLFVQFTRKTAKNVSELLAQKGGTVIFINENGQQVPLSRKGPNGIMLGLYSDMKELGFNPDEAKEILDPPAKPVASGLKKV